MDLNAAFAARAYASARPATQPAAAPRAPEGPADGFSRLAGSFADTLERAETTAESLGGAITLAFPAGTQTIEVLAPTPILQTRLLWLCPVLALILAAVLVNDRRATRLPGPRRGPPA